MCINKTLITLLSENLHRASDTCHQCRFLSKSWLNHLCSGHMITRFWSSFLFIVCPRRFLINTPILMPLLHSTWIYVHIPRLFEDDFMTCEVNRYLDFLGPSSDPGLCIHSSPGVTDLWPAAAVLPWHTCMFEWMVLLLMFLNPLLVLRHLQECQLEGIEEVFLLDTSMCLCWGAETCKKKSTTG